MPTRRNTRGQTRRGPGRPSREKPYQPSTQQLEIYAAISSGKTQQSIAEQFSVTRQRIAAVCVQVERWLLPQYMDDIRQIKTRHSEHLWHIFREAMAAWERSKQDAESTTEKESAGVVEITRTTKGQSGDSRHLDVATKALQDIRKIWGADAPIEMRFHGELRVAGKSVDEANRELAEEIEKARQRLLAVTTGTAARNPCEN